VDQGEGFTDAAYREVREELGVEVEIDFIVGTTHFYRGEEDPENEIIGVLFCCSLKDSAAIKRGWEHSQHRWITAQEAARLFPSDHWLGKTIRRAETIREMLSPALLAHYRTVGFDL
jgi:8-oxo-dGTP pyrophosphatase MutT (NUDIX family)